MKKPTITLCVLYASVFVFSIQATPERREALTASHGIPPCEPSYVLLETSSRLQAVRSARTTLALIGCRSDLLGLSAQDLAAAESDLLKMADAADWWNEGSLNPKAQALARSRISVLLKLHRPVTVFFHNSAKDKG